MDRDAELIGLDSNTLLGEQTIDGVEKRVQADVRVGAQRKHAIANRVLICCACTRCMARNENEV